MNFIQRSLLVFLVISFSAAVQAETPSWTPKAGSQLSFSLRSKGNTVGTLVFDFTQSGDRIVERRVEHLELSRLLVNAVLDQTSESVWRGKTLESYASSTILKSSLKNSTAALKVTKQANGKLLAVDQESTTELPAEAWPLTLWSRDFISHPQLFDLTRGHAITLSSVSKGPEALTVDGAAQTCERVEVKVFQDGKDAKAVVWFDTAGRLCAMQLPSALGTVDYVRTSSK
ncbi:DUF6134 family protein [Stenotrophobium rhamnosiphilum]|uniref:DUF3108 domain-containing protein n=1 Tax=Stenotrophobium rhamnosiphilum TaxID=2029166 RepID=A0A2T5MH61_9GAMM|nr:DUF6134 family protein [Stenotrophobium rhamnosiphilum]PTU31879.1 hypothetical protein CJD38_04115 [Stenotrophobium rhamnosiphilum]